MDLKDKIIKALGDTEYEYYDTEALLDLLISRMLKQQGRIFQLTNSNNEELKKLQQDRKELHKEISEIRRNPNLLLTSVHYFVAPDNKRRYAVNLSRGQVQLSEHVKNIGVMFQEISPREFTDMI